MYREKLNIKLLDPVIRRFEDIVSGCQTYYLVALFHKISDEIASEIDY